MQKVVDGAAVTMTPREERELQRFLQEQNRIPQVKTNEERIAELEEALDLLLSGQTEVKP